jgi:hypothetical protein
VVAVAIVCVFAALSLLHVYWAFGGNLGVDAAVPERPRRPGGGGDQQLVKAFRPSFATTLLVAGVLASVCVLVSLRAGLITPVVTHWSVRWLIIAIAFALLARAVGEFNLVGFFKRVHGSVFARLDTWLYSPLCVVLSLGLLKVAFS